MNGQGLYNKDVKEILEADDKALDAFFVSDDERDDNIATYLADPSLVTMVASSSKVELLAFNLVGEEYAIDILEIQEIIKLPEVTSLPRIIDFVLGIVSLRGTIVPIVDLRKLMGLGDTVYSRATRVLVIRSGDEPIGIVVDGVTSVLRIDKEAIEPKPRTMQRGSSEFFKGVGRVEGRLLILLDAEAVSLALDSAI